jgi:hypothetical protein
MEDKEKEDEKKRNDAVCAVLQSEVESFKTSYYNLVTSNLTLLI